MGEREQLGPNVRWALRVVCRDRDEQRVLEMRKVLVMIAAPHSTPVAGNRMTASMTFR